MLFKKVNSLYNSLEKLFAVKESIIPFLVFYRVAISLVAIIEITSLFPDLHLFFSQYNTLIPQELMYIQSGYFKYLHVFYVFLEENNLTAVFYKLAVPIYILALLSLLTGFFTRYTALLALLLQLIIFRSFAPFNYGYDYFLTMSLFYCFVFPVGRYYSIDEKIFKYASKENFNYRRVLQIHLAIAYCLSGVSKGLDPGWWNGNSVWKAIASVDNSFFSISPLILTFVGIGTVLLEFLYPLLIFLKPTRKYALTAIILMHVSIAIMMELYAFSAIMIVWNIAAYGTLKEKAKHVETV
ncbi:HTTM domain-containing protein [Flammeovirga sp. SJP92]|uniref:HTTM domain-containing protein n=1 Tax=Flammeovirga sp. SJP92 TaxID=1775430 RepID=UPI00078764FD|nr:HTTM domain-containing protein [Flammeovirga sp. SJP92]KXX72611.1 hypothetical protein AVL50_06310 [Flammeovirga sp. SJP92]